ncbi:MAG TPA: hypothetical protein DIT10_23955 [Chryseobacterium sp.]|jgi:hypothetical protein|nr:hypothetical protein [Chryseobacterium sp.]
MFICWQEISLIFTINVIIHKYHKIMEPTKKNKPNSLVVILFALIVLMIVIYFILAMFFPTVFDLMNTGDIQPVPNK